MPNVKISELPVASTPLAGTELVPIVQGGITEQVTVDNLTANRAINALDVTVTNLTASQAVLTDAGKKLVSVATTGTGDVVRATDPTMTLANATGLSLTTGVTGTLVAANGGTGITTPGASGNLLTSNGTAWVSSAPAAITAVTTFSGGTTGLTPSAPTSGVVSLAGTLVAANGGTGLTVPGSTGNVLTSDGTGWVSSPVVATPTLNIVTGTTQAATANNHYVLTNVASTTVTLPVSPAAGNLVWVTVGNGLTTNVVARNGSNIQSLAEDLTLDATYAAVQMRYINSTIGWTFV